MKERRERNFRILEFRENKFDIIGDVHGCYDELMELIERLGYEKKDGCYTHPEGRRLISVGDVADKGCQNLACLDFWIEQVNNGGAFWVHGNHCNKLYRYFLGNRVHLSHGLERTVAELEALRRKNAWCFAADICAAMRANAFIFCWTESVLQWCMGACVPDPSENFPIKYVRFVYMAKQRVILTKTVSLSVWTGRRNMTGSPLWSMGIRWRKDPKSSTVPLISIRAVFMAAI